MFTLRNGSEALIVPPSHSLSVFVGRAVFDIVRRDGDLTIAEGASHRLGEVNIGYDYAGAARFTAPQGVVLGHGDGILIGRKTGLTTAEPNLRDPIDRGIAVYGPGEVFDEQRTELLADRTLRLALHADTRLSRRHAAIAIESDFRVTVHDLASANGTGISVQPLPS